VKLYSNGQEIMGRSSKDETYSEQETQRRFEAALRGALNTPPTPLKDLPRKRPKKRKRRVKSRGSFEYGRQKT
jgi:hypothetical protein